MIWSALWNMPNKIVWLFKEDLNVALHQHSCIGFDSNAYLPFSMDGTEQNFFFLAPGVQNALFMTVLLINIILSSIINSIIKQCC